MRELLAALIRSASFSWWSLRRRAGQILPVTCAFFLLVAATQMVGTLHDIASVATRQKIAQSWHMPYDLYVRPLSTVSQPERDAGWIDPQSVLESYGGINARQLAGIAALPHVVQVLPFATIGWQSIAIQVPLSFIKRGVYRVSATWTEQEITSVYYIDVTNLVRLTDEVPVTNLNLEHLVLKDTRSAAMFAMPVQAVQAVIGVPEPRQKLLLQELLGESVTPSTLHLSIHVDKLAGDLSILSACVQRVSCWRSADVHQGVLNYRVNGVQVVRYSHTNYSATAQQLAAGQVAIAQSDADMQGPLYRVLVNEHILVQGSSLLQGVSSAQEIPLLPLSGPERLPLLADAIRSIPLAEACAINGDSCYSGLFVRLNGVEQYSKNSLALLQATSAAITARTGLHVDILDGSSLRHIAVLTSTLHGSVVVPTSWRVVGVAVQIVHGLDALQETLLILCAGLCLLASGASGVLIGVGRRKEVQMLQQLGWQRRHLWFNVMFDALVLCLPGCLLAVSWLVLSTSLWTSSIGPFVEVWLLLSGVAVYCCLYLATANSVGISRKPWRLSSRQRSIVLQKVIAPITSSSATAAAIFLIAVEYLLLANFNQVLVVTVLGSQVRAALEAPQLALLLLILAAAMLTVGLCMILVLRGRREEITLLARVGWERRFVLLRLLWGNWRLAVLSGEVGVMIALGVTMLGGMLPSLFIGASLIVLGPFIGVLLVSVVALGPAWQETKRVYPWR